MRESKGRGAHGRKGKADGAVTITKNKTKIYAYISICVCLGASVTNHKIPGPHACGSQSGWVAMLFDLPSLPEGC